MNYNRFGFPRYLVGVAATVVFGACTSAGSLQSPGTDATAFLPPSRTTKSFFNPEAKAKPLIFVATQSGDVDIFLQAKKHTMVGQITGFNYPTDVATDASGDLYVTSEYVSSVPVFAPPYTNGPKLTLSTPNYNPYGVAVSRNDVVAVLMTCATSCATYYAVNFYAEGSTTPCVTIPVANGPDVPYTGAFDHAGDLFLVGQINQGPYIAEITGGCRAKTVKALTAGNTLHRLFDVHANKSDQIAILDTDAGYIYTYNLPQRGSLGNPVSSINLGKPEEGFNFVMLASGRDLYANLNLTGVTEFDYPSGHQKKTITINRASNEAVTPPLIP